MTGAVLAFWSFPAQALFNGASLGLGYAVIAAGIVLIYRSSGIINFAQAAMGTFGAASFAVLFLRYDVPYPLAMAIGVAGSVLLGVATELLVVRRLFNASRVVLLIATVGIAQLVAFLIIEVLPDTSGGRLPTAFDAAWAEMRVSDSFLIGTRQTSLLVLIAPVLVALAWFLNKTRMGLHIRAVADSPDNARLVGVSPRKVSTIVWALAAGFAGYTQIAIAPLVSRTADDLAGVSTTGLLLRALVIAMAARMRSIPIVVVAGIGLGVVESIVTINLNRDVGVFDGVLFLLVIAMVVFVPRLGGRTGAAFSVGVRQYTIPEALKSIWWVRHMSAIGLAVLLLAFVAVPFVQSQPSQLLVWTELLIVAMIAISLTLLTGWAGQLSLGQAALAGVGGLSALAFTRGQPMGVGLPWIGELFTVTFDVPWLIGILLGTALGVFFAVLVGMPALRVRGLFLAVSTLAFGTMAASWMFNRSFWSGGVAQVSSARAERPQVFGVDLGSPRAYYYLCLFFLAVVVVLVAHLRRTGAGRVITAVRDNEQMTSVATVSPARAKLAAFAVSGGIAALAGGLYVFLLPGFRLGDSSPFAPVESLQFVATAIIGGIGSIAGAILGALWVNGLPAAFGATDEVQLLSANIGLLILLLYLPGGLVQIVYSLRDLLLRYAATRLQTDVDEDIADEIEADGATAGIEDDVPVVTEPKRLTAREREVELPSEGVPWLATSSVSVTFGGVRAVDDVSIDVHEGEIVGLIGTNGAGKSTLMNAISGFVPHTGTISVLGKDVTSMSAHRRHDVGLGRGFQDALLFGSLTVRETVLVALEARRRSMLVPSIFALPPSPQMEMVKRSEADEILDFLGLGPNADSFVADQSTGTRRVIELACLLATDAKVLLLDEPTAGIAQHETERFAPLIRQVKSDLGASVVLIEHDMPLVMALSDRIYCLEAGGVIAEGTPQEVSSNPAVIASYLGTDERAIERSNQDVTA